MNLAYVLYAVMTMGGLALVLGAILGVASIRFHIEVDPRVAHVVQVLPGSNCGACGFAGCEAAAEAIVKGEVTYDVCVAGGREVAKRIAGILGVEAEETGAPKVAVVGCGGGSGKVKTRFLYEGIHKCAAANQLVGGQLACDYGCLGFGDCATDCPFDALHMGKDNLPKVDREKCTACGICIAACPRGIMRLVPVTGDYAVACNSLEKGKFVRKVCEIGCIACKICEKACPIDSPAIVVQENLALFNYDTCTNCGTCFDKCPTKCIQKVVKETRVTPSSVVEASP